MEKRVENPLLPATDPGALCASKQADVPNGTDVQTPALTKAALRRVDPLS